MLDLITLFTILMYVCRMLCTASVRYYILSVTVYAIHINFTMQ